MLSDPKLSLAMVSGAGLFWQFANQSYNVLNNYVNRGGKGLNQRLTPRNLFHLTRFPCLVQRLR